MALAIGVSSVGRAATATSATTDTGVTTQASGSTLLIGFSDPNANVAPSDNKGNRYIPLGIMSAGTTTLRVWKCENAKGGSGHLATVTASSGTLDGSITFVEITAAAGKTAVVDKIAKIMDNTAPQSVTSAALSGTGEFGLCWAASNTIVGSYAESTGYTIAQQETNSALYWTSVVVYKANIGTAAESPNFPSVGSGVATAIIFAAFREINAGPSVGASGGDWQLDGVGTSPSNVTLNTQATGSALVVLEAAELAKMDAPTYNGGAAMTLLQSNPGYNGGLWPGFGYELYGQNSISGGTGHVVSAVKPVSPAQESSLIAIEVRDATAVASSTSINVAGAGAGVAYTGPSIAVSGPALLIATWSGDGGVGTTDQSVTVPDEWTLLEYKFLASTAYIQTATAVRLVDAGTYSTAWTPAVNQGAILGIMAVTAGASAPSITTDPTNQRLAAGAVATLTAAAAGATSQQWQSNATGSWVDIAGATSTTYVTSALAAGLAYAVRCGFANATGTTYTNPADIWTPATKPAPRAGIYSSGGRVNRVIQAAGVWPLSKAANQAAADELFLVVAAAAGSVAAAAGTGAATAVGNALIAQPGASAGVGTAVATGRAIFNAVGAAAGTGTPAAVGNGVVAAVGAAAGAGTPAATGRGIANSVAATAGTGAAAATSLATAAATGAAAGTGTPAATGQATVAAVGSSAGTSTAPGVGTAGGSTSAGDGASAGAGAASATGAATANSVAATAGLGAATGAGNALIPAPGAAAGTSVVAATGAATGRGVGAAAGVGAASATGATTAAATGATAGVGAASAASNTVIAAVGSSAGVGAAAAVGSSAGAGQGVGASAGVGAAAATGRATAASAGASAGQGTPAAVGAATAASPGAAAGSGAAAAVGVTIRAAVGSSSGSGAATAAGQGVTAAVGSSSGASAVAAGGRSVYAGLGQANGSSIVLGVTGLTVTGVGTASGSSSADARSQDRTLLFRGALHPRTLPELSFTRTAPQTHDARTWVAELRVAP